MYLFWGLCILSLIWLWSHPTDWPCLLTEKMDLESLLKSSYLIFSHSKWQLSYRYNIIQCLYWNIEWLRKTTISNFNVYCCHLFFFLVSLVRTCHLKMLFRSKCLSLIWLWSAILSVWTMWIKCWKVLWRFSTNLTWNSEY